MSLQCPPVKVPFCQEAPSLPAFCKDVTWPLRISVRACSLCNRTGLRASISILSACTNNAITIHESSAQRTDGKFSHSLPRDTWRHICRSGTRGPSASRLPSSRISCSMNFFMDANNASPAAQDGRQQLAKQFVTQEGDGFRSYFSNLTGNPFFTAVRLVSPPN